MNNNIAFIIWMFMTAIAISYVLNLLLACFSLKTVSVEIGPYQTTTLETDQNKKYLGAGQVEVKKEGANFTILMNNGEYVTTGAPLPQNPGEDIITFASSFRMEPGYTYYTEDTSVTMYSLEGKTITKQYYPYGDFFALSFIAFIFWVILSLFLSLF